MFHTLSLPGMQTKRIRHFGHLLSVRYGVIHMIDMIGKWISYLRKEQNISRKKLCRGLCTETRLRRIEEQGQGSEKLLIDALLQRLGVSINKYHLLLEDDEYDLLLHRIRIRKLLRQSGKNPDSLALANHEIQTYDQKHGTKTKVQHQFICLQKAELLRRQDADWNSQWDIVCAGLRQTISASFWNAAPAHPVSRLKLSSLKNCYFSMLEMLFLERYAVLLEEKDSAEAIRWYHALADYILQDGRDGAECRAHYPFLAYHMAKYYQKSGQPHSAVKLLEQALDMFAVSKLQCVLCIKCLTLKQEIQKELAAQEKAPHPPAWEEQRLAVFYEMLGDQKEIWQENYYPPYLELYALGIGQTIKTRRESFALTQKQLASDICDIGTLSRIERCECSPQTWTKTLLFEKLHMTLLKYDGGIVTEEYSDYRRVAAMWQAYDENEYSTAKKLFEELQGRMPEEYLTNRQFTEFWSIRLQAAAGQLTEDERLTRLWALLEASFGDRARYASYYCLPLRSEQKIFHDIMWNNLTDDPQFLYDILKRQYDIMEGTELEVLFPEHFITLLYCLGNKAWVLDKNEEALSYTEEPLKKICYFANESHMGALLFLKGWILRGMHDEDNSKKALRQSYVVETMLSKYHVTARYIEAQVQKLYPGLLDDLSAPD